MTNFETFILGIAVTLAVVGIKKLVDYFAARRAETDNDIYKVNERAREAEFQGNRNANRLAECDRDIKFLRESLETAGSTIAGLHDELRESRHDVLLLAQNFNLCFTTGPHGRAIGNTKRHTATEATNLTH